MNVCDAWIDKVAKILPEECLVRDLVKAKVFSTPFTAHFARKAGKSPPYFKLGKRIMYPKEGVIRWLHEQKREGLEKGDPAEK